MRNFADIDELITLYRTKEQICIFTGAGVSFTCNDRYRAPGWTALLKQIFLDLMKGYGHKDAGEAFSALKAENPDPWDLATEVKAHAKTDQDFLTSIRKVILKENESLDIDGRLKEKNLRGAETLNALISFCSSVREIKRHPCFEVNPKVKAVLTANYDWFLEAGATIKHQAGLFKPMTRPGSSLKRKQLPVYHIHGYIPFGKSGEENLMPEEPLILDRKSYECAYRPGSWTLDILDIHLAHYTTLFIGFSFNDRYFLNYLQSLAEKPQTPVHFAFMCNKERRPAGLLDELAKTRVRPILYADHIQIPDLLKTLYLSVIPHNGHELPLPEGQKRLFHPPAIWDMLKMDKAWTFDSEADQV